MLIRALTSRAVRPFKFGFNFALVFATLTAFGCSPSHPETAPTSGTVSYGGKPLAHVMVMFFPQNVSEARIGYAKTDAEGRFKAVSTFGTGDGVVVGHHNVSITEAWPPDIKEVPKDATGMEKSPPRGPWDAKYRDSATGALQVDVIAKQENFFEFDLMK